MSGPEHYREAERLLAASTGREVLEYAEAEDISEDDLTASLAVALAAAQVHATLALAAARIETGFHGLSDPVRAQWSEAIS